MNVYRYKALMYRSGTLFHILQYVLKFPPVYYSLLSLPLWPLSIYRDSFVGGHTVATTLLLLNMALIQPDQTTIASTQVLSNASI